jgi:excisionase family DNA binding protein
MRAVRSRSVAAGCVGVDPVYTIADVAAHMQASPRTVWRLIQAGRIRTIRSGRLVRISASALNSFLQEASCG